MGYSQSDEKENQEEERQEDHAQTQMDAASQTVRSLSHWPDWEPEEGAAMLKRIQAIGQGWLP